MPLDKLRNAFDFLHTLFLICVLSVNYDFLLKYYIFNSSFNILIISLANVDTDYNYKTFFSKLALPKVGIENTTFDNIENKSNFLF